MQPFDRPHSAFVLATWLIGLAGCSSAGSALNGSGSGSCGGEWARPNGPRGGAPAGAACSDYTQCAEASCDCGNGQRYYAAACVNGVCDNRQACACVQQQLSFAGQGACGAVLATSSPSTCSGESGAAQPGPHSGAPAGAACSDSSQCAEAVCDCANGQRYYAAACVNGVCNNAGACACVDQKLGGNACGPTAVASTCSGASGTAQAGPRAGAPAGAACSDSSQCAQAVCQCGNGNYYYAAACVAGVCDNTSACSCVAQQLQTTTGQNACY